MEIIKKIGGIGTKRGEALEKAGIRSLEDLRRMDIEVASQSTGMGKELLRQFKAMAELQRIPTIDQQLSAALVRKGNIYDLVQLANSSPSELQDTIAASIKDGMIPEKYNTLGAGDFQSWGEFALDLSCYEQLRSDREYLNYLIDLSGESPSELEERYHQRFTPPEDENAEDENSPIETIKICIEVLQGDLDEKKQEDPEYDYKSQEEWAEETGDTSDYGYLQYLLSEEAQSDDAEEIKKTAHILSEHFKINFSVDPLEITTRVRQAILTLQAALRGRGLLKAAVFQAEELTDVMGEPADYPDASNGQALRVEQRGPYLLCYYDLLLPATGTFTFHLKIDDNKKDNLPILKISLRRYDPDSGSQEDVAEREITRGEFLSANQYQDFVLSASDADRAKIEWYGTTDIWAASMHFKGRMYVEEWPVDADKDYEPQLGEYGSIHEKGVFAKKVEQPVPCLLCYYNCPLHSGAFTFRLKIDDNKKDNLPILKISITGYDPDSGPEENIAEREITRGEFPSANQYQDFTLSASDADKAKIEWYGTTDIWAASMHFEGTVDVGEWGEVEISKDYEPQPGECGSIQPRTVFAEKVGGGYVATLDTPIFGVTGENEAIFRMASARKDEKRYLHDLAATLHVCAENGDVLGVREIFVSDFMDWLTDEERQENRTSYQDFSVPFKLARATKSFFRIYGHNNVTLLIDKITIRPRLLYRAEWNELLDELDFPENFVTFKSPLIKGTEPFNQMLDEADKILSESTLGINIYREKDDREPSLRIREELNDERLKFYFDRFRKWTSLINYMLTIEAHILEGHQKSFDEEYTTALGKYAWAEEQIRNIFQYTFPASQLEGTPKDLDSLSKETESLGRNEIRARIGKMMDLVVAETHSSRLDSLFQPFTHMGDDKFWHYDYPIGFDIIKRFEKIRDSKRSNDLGEALTINLSDYANQILKVYKFEWSKDQTEPYFEIGSICRIPIELERSDVDFIFNSLEKDKYFESYENYITFIEFPEYPHSDPDSDSVEVRTISPRPLFELTVHLFAILGHHYFHTLPLAIGDTYNRLGSHRKAKNYYNLLYDEFAQITQDISYFKVIKGEEWDIDPTKIVLKKKAEPAYVIAGKEYWTDYMIELEARKIDGSEGFLILFRYQDERDWLCWKIGGWGNTQSAIEFNRWEANQIVDGSVTQRDIDCIERDQWYKIQIVVRGNEVSCSIDGISMQCSFPAGTHSRGCIGLGGWDTLVEYRNIKVTPLDPKAVYPYLNATIEHPLMAIRMAQNYLDWGNVLYRQQSDESVQRAKDLYKKALLVHEAEEWCEQDLYGVMEEAVDAVIEADLGPGVAGEVINAMEDARYEANLSQLKTLYESVANIAMSGEPKGNIIAGLSGLLNQDLRQTWQEFVDVRKEPVPAPFERVLVPTTTTNQSMISAHALAPGRVDSRYGTSERGIVPYGPGNPGPICKLENPLILKQKREACLRIYMIEQGLNYLGYRNNYLSIFRYDYLVQQAKAFANLALSAEREFLSFKEKFESESLTNLQAQQALALALATVQLEELRRSEAVDRLTLSRMQVGQVYAQINELEKRLAAIDWTDYVESIFDNITNIEPETWTSITKEKAKVAVYEILGSPATFYATTEALINFAGVVGKYAGPVGLVASVGIQLWKGVSAVDDQIEALENQIRRLKTQDLPLAKQNVQVAKDQLMIAVKQKDIAIMKAGFLQEILEFLKSKFLNEEMWSYLARSIKEIYQLYMEYAITLAWLAERALEFERGSEINRIRFNYFSAERQGLLAAENLTRDIASLEYDKLVTEEKKIPIKQIVSLAQLFPQQLSTFLKNGKTEFYIPLELFDSLYPGLYQARLKNVELLIASAVPLTDIHGTLTNFGVSRIRALDHKAAGKRFVEMAIYNQPETITLSSYAIKEDQFMFQPSEAEKILRPFEGMGVDSYWILDMSKEVNDIDFSQIIDVQLILYYTAQYDEDLKNKVIETLPRIQARIQPFSLKHKAAELFEEFISPAEDNRARDMRIFSFETRETEFPTNQEQRRIKNLFFFSKNKDGGIAPLTAHIFSAQHPEAVRVESNKGFMASNIGADDQYADPSPLNALTDLNVAGRWYLKILPEDNPHLLKKNAAGNVVSDPGNGFLRVSGPTDMGTPKIQGAWPNDLGVIAKVRLDKGQVRFRLRKSEQGEYRVDFASEDLCLHRSEPRDGAWTREMLWQDQTPHLENTWYEIGILVIQDMIQVFVDGVERIKYKDEDGTFTQGSFALHPINESEDSSIDIDDFQIQEVDQFGIAKADLFEDKFTGGLENWDIGGGNWEVSFETSTVNPTLDLAAIEDILVLMEYEYVPGLEPTHLRENPEVDEIDLPASSNLVEISPDGRWCCILSQEQKKLFVLSTTTKRIVRTLVLAEEGRVPRGIAISPDGTSAFISMHVVKVRLVTEWMSPDEAEDLLASLESVEGYQGLFTIEEGTWPSGAAAGWEMSVERKPGLRLLAGTFPRAGIPLIISDPWGNTVSLVSGSKPEHGQGGFETPIWDNGNYTIRFLDQTFQVLVQDDFVFVTFTELTARLVTAWLPVADAQELWEDLEADENYQGVFKVGDRDSIIHVDLNEHTTSEIHSWNAGSGPHRVVLSPDGRYLYVAMRDRGSIFSIDLPAEAGPEKIKEISVGEQPEYLALSPDGKTLYVVQRGNSPRLWIVDIEEGSVSEPIEVEHDPNDLAISPDGHTLYVTNSYGQMSVIDTNTKEDILTLDIEPGAKKVAFSPDGKRAYVTVAGESEGKLLVIDTAAVRAKAFDQDINPIVGHVSLRENPNDIAVHPLGVRAYVVHDSTNKVSIIE